MGSDWIDTLNARRAAAAEPQTDPRPLPGEITAHRAAPAPAVDVEGLKSEMSQLVRDEVGQAMTGIAQMLEKALGAAATPQPATTAPPVAAQEPAIAPAGVAPAQSAPAAAPAAPEGTQASWPAAPAAG